MKKIVSFLGGLLLMLALAVPGFAQEQYIFDGADMLTDDQESELQDQASQIAEDWDCGVYFISLEDFHDTGEEDAYEAAKELFLSRNLGLGEDQSGVLLMMSLSNRKMALIAHGYGNAAITDRINEDIRSTIKVSFKNDDWYEGVRDYVAEAGTAIENARNRGVTEKDVVVYTTAPLGYRLLGCVICFLIALAAAYGVTGVLKGQLKSVAKKAEAVGYESTGALKLQVREDRYTHTSTERVYSPEKTESSDGGDCTSVDSDGFSGSSDDF